LSEKAVDKYKACYIVANDNFTIANNFNTMSFRQNTIHDYHVEETLTGVGFVEAGYHEYQMRESLQFNNKFNEKYISDDEVVIKSDIENSSKFKSIVRASSEHKRKIKIKIIDEFIKSEKKEMTEDSANNLYISNEAKDKQIRVNKFNLRPFINDTEKVFEQYESDFKKEDEIVFKKKVKSTFFGGEKTISTISEEVIGCHEIKTKKPQKEFDYDNFLKIKPQASRMNNKEEILIRNIPGEEKLYSNIQRLKRKNDNDGKKSRIERVVVYDSRKPGDEEKSGLNKSHHLDLSKEKLIEESKREHSNSSLDKTLQDKPIPTGGNNIKTILTSLNTHNVNSSYSNDELSPVPDHRGNVIEMNHTKFKSNGNSVIDTTRVNSGFAKDNVSPNTVTHINEHDGMLYKIKTSIMDERTTKGVATTVDVRGYKEADPENTSSFIELIVQNCYNKVRTRC
jgi:hypothetical protein